MARMRRCLVVRGPIFSLRCEELDRGRQRGEMASKVASFSFLRPLPEAEIDHFPSLPCRRHALFQKDHGRKPELGALLSEAAGQAVAECTAIVCCCPFGMANFLYMATIKLPAGLLRRALRRRKLAGVGFVNKTALRGRVGPLDDDEFSVHSGTLFVTLPGDDAWPAKVATPELLALEKEMSARFHGTGFWRSPSQTE